MKIQQLLLFNELFLPKIKHTFLFFSQLCTIRSLENVTHWAFKSGVFPKCTQYYKECGGKIFKTLPVDRGRKEKKKNRLWCDACACMLMSICECTPVSMYVRKGTEQNGKHGCLKPLELSHRDRILIEKSTVVILHQLPFLCLPPPHCLRTRGPDLSPPISSFLYHFFFLLLIHLHYKIQISRNPFLPWSIFPAVNTTLSNPSLALLSVLARPAASVLTPFHRLRATSKRLFVFSEGLRSRPGFVISISGPRVSFRQGP